MTKPDYQQLIAKAKEASSKAYCPYSGCSVGAALLCVDGKIFTGCNAENTIIGITICAERTAITKAISEGYREFRAIAVFSPKSSFFMPCGVCRQFLSEFGLDLDVAVENEGGAAQVFKLKELLPGASVAGANIT